MAKFARRQSGLSRLLVCSLDPTRVFVEVLKPKLTFLCTTAVLPTPKTKAETSGVRMPTYNTSASVRRSRASSLCGCCGASTDQAWVPCVGVACTCVRRIVGCIVERGGDTVRVPPDCKSQRAGSLYTAVVLCRKDSRLDNETLDNNMSSALGRALMVGARGFPAAGAGRRVGEVAARGRGLKTNPHVEVSERRRGARVPERRGELAAVGALVVEL